MLRNRTTQHSAAGPFVHLLGLIASLSLLFAQSSGYTTTWQQPHTIRRRFGLHSSLSSREFGGVDTSASQIRCVHFCSFLFLSRWAAGATAFKRAIGQKILRCQLGVPRTQIQIVARLFTRTIVLACKRVKQGTLLGGGVVNGRWAWQRCAGDTRDAKGFVVLFVCVI